MGSQRKVFLQQYGSRVKGLLHSVQDHAPPALSPEEHDRHGPGAPVLGQRRRMDVYHGKGIRYGQTVIVPRAQQQRTALLGQPGQIRLRHRLQADRYAVGLRHLQHPGIELGDVVCFAGEELQDPALLLQHGAQSALKQVDPQICQLHGH